MKRRLLTGLLTIVTALSGVISSSITANAAVQTPVTTVNLAAKAGIAVDAKTGQILYNKNADRVLPIASMSKLLTATLVLKAIDEQRLHWSTKVTIDKGTAKLSKKMAYTNVPLTAGHKYTVKSLYQAALVGSANAAAMALGNKVAGSPVKFQTAMRDEAEQLGLTSTKLYNACGLTNEQVGQNRLSGVKADAENEMSARDMAKLSVHLLKDYPEILKTTKLTHFKFSKNQTVTSSDKMLPGMANNYPALKVDGLKTGTSDKAGANFTATGTYQGRRLVTVVMGATGDEARFTETQRMMSFVYQNFQPVNFYEGKQVTGASNMLTHDATERTIGVGVSSPFNIWLRKNQTAANITGKLKVDPKHVVKLGLEAPVEKNHFAGTTKLRIAGDKLGFLDGPTYTAKVKTLAEVQRANFFVRLWNHFLDLF